MLQLVESSGPWAWIDPDGETLEESYKNKMGKHDELRREIFEAHPDKPFEQTTIMVSSTGAVMKRPQEEFAKVARLIGANRARSKRNVGDEAIR
jgi:hypothetical protein